MRRLVLAGLAALLIGSAAVATAAAPPSARLRGFVCQRALDPPARGLSVTAVMRPITGTAKMAMRFELLKRSRRYGRATSVAGPNLKSWIAPRHPSLAVQPGGRWVVKHPVVDLAAPAFYQLKVAFRWSGTDGKVISKVVHLSPECFQPELRPDLAVTAIQTSPIPSAPGQDLYSATIENRGKTGAGTFQVQLVEQPPGQPLTVETKTVPGLRPHDQRTVRFQAPACSAAAPATITADPTGVIDDPNRNNNSIQTSCS